MYIVVGLFIMAMGLIFAEFFIPGGILGIAGAAVLLGSLGAGMYYFPDYAIFIVVAELLGLVVCIVLGLYMMRHSRFQGLMMLADRQDPERGWVSPSEDPSLVGQICEAHTALRPAGSIECDGRKVDAVSTGELIPAGAKVRVVDVEGHRVVVEIESASEDGG